MELDDDIFRLAGCEPAGDNLGHGNEVAVVAEDDSADVANAVINDAAGEPAVEA